MSQTEPEQRPRAMHDPQVHQIEVEMQNEDLRRVQKELEASRNEYSALYDQAPVGYVTLSGEGLIVRANGTLATLLGVERSSLAGLPLTCFIVPEDQELLDRQRRELGLTGVSSICELHMVRRDDVFWAAIKTILRPGDESGPPSYWATVDDISERKQAEEALRESTEKYRTVADFAYDWEAWHAPDGTCRYVSPSCERITGHTAAEFLADPTLMLRITHADDQPMLAEHWRAVEQEANEATFEFDFRILTPDGETRWISHSCTPVFGTDGQWAGRRESNHDSTERRKMQDDLQRLAAIVESTVDAITSVDMAGYVVSWNQGAEKLFGYSAAEAIGQLWHGLIAPNQSSDFLQIVETVRRGEAVRRVETTCVAKDGRIIEVVVTLSPVKSTTGQVIGVSSIAQDITGRKVAEAALSRSQALLNEMGKIARVGGWEIDIASGTQVWTEEVYRIHEVDFAFQPTVSTGIEFYAPASRPLIAQAVQHAIESGEPFDVELEFITAKGRPRWVHSLGVANLAAGKIFGTIHDITEYKRAEQALRESEARYQDLYESAPDMYLSVDPQTGQILQCNQTVATMTGFAKDEIIGRPVFEMYHPDCLADARRALQRFMTIGEVDDAELQVCCKDGSLLDVSLNVSAVRDKSGKIVHSRSSWRDITRRKRQEKEIFRLTTTLEQQVQERTAQLAAAVADLERAARLKDEFLAAISHELRTPLVGVLGMAEALEMQFSGLLNERQLHFVQSIHQSGDRLLSMVNSILRYAALLGGKAKLHQEPCRLDEICAIAIRSVRARAEKKDQTVEFSIGRVGISIISDADGIIQAVQQLLDNAVKFTPAGGRIRLDAREDSHADTVRLIVSDTGIGISAEQQAIIFQPFVQGDATLARKYEGVGLGLAYVQRMVELLGGTIIVESVLGEGSRFTITLPIGNVTAS